MPQKKTGHSNHSKPSPDKNAGARAVRQAAYKYLKAEIKTYSAKLPSPYYEGMVAAFKAAHTWLKAEARRTGKLPGGIGRQ